MKIRTYRDDQGTVVEVVPGLGGDTWIVARRGSGKGSHHRIVSPALPVRNTRLASQIDLDEYAAAKGWREIKG